MLERFGTMRDGTARSLAPALALAGLFGTVVLVTGRPTPFGQAVAALTIAVMVGHAAITLGRIDAAVFACICLGVTFTIENIGIATGIPFGHYHFEVGADLPRIGAVPIIVGPLYLGVGYPAWIIANLLLGCETRPAHRSDIVAVPALAAIIMVQWDLAMDPPNATVARAWIWHDGGSYFGVPISNFAGWFVTTFTFFQIFALVRAHRRCAGEPSAREVSRRFMAVPVLFYLAAGLCRLPPLLEGDATVLDGAGQAWSSAGVRASSALVMVVAMIPMPLLALFRLFTDPDRPVTADAEPTVMRT